MALIKLVVVKSFAVIKNHQGCETCLPLNFCHLQYIINMLAGKGLKLSIAEYCNNKSVARLKSIKF